MKQLTVLKDVFDTLEWMANNERGMPSHSIEELAEAVLQGGIAAKNARALLSFSKHPDREGAWTRFISNTRRTFGSNWRSALFEPQPFQVRNDPNLCIYVCTNQDCMELAWGHQCDQCITRHMGQ